MLSLTLYKLFKVYFTPFPYVYYHKSKRIGNFAYSGIGLGLIYYQQIFWISNLGFSIFFYYNNTIGFYGKLPLFFISSSLNLISLSRTIYLIRYI
jgi:hypothetical protein